MTIEGYEGERVLVSYDVSGSARGVAARVCQIVFGRRRISEGRGRPSYREKGFIHRPGVVWIGQSVLVMPPRDAVELAGVLHRLGVRVATGPVSIDRASLAAFRRGPVCRLNMLTGPPARVWLKYPRPLSCDVVRTYADAGVSQDEKAAHIAALVSALTYRRRGVGRPLTKIGHFTGLGDFGAYALSLCTDSVGTKVLVAKEMRRWDTIGIDCVAMNVNDIICVGAEPIAFVDYVAIESYDREVAHQIGIGLNRGAEMANVSIVGRGSGVVPGPLRGFDLAGTRFGAGRESKD